ncbi:hypothetical protein [Spirillospora sp. NPDC029432]|uniref:hypothetical protein n=1 Tax=Spirillospora sp. NPDC029432 TaxID=3154599 RepID=UPI003455EF44
MADRSGTPPAAPPGAVLFAARFTRAFDVATVITVAGWQVGAAGTALLVYLGRYHVPALAVLVWGVQLLIIVAGSVLLLRGVTSAAATWGLVAADLVAGAAMAANCPGGEQLMINWAWATAGLIGVLLLLRRRMRELIALLLVNAGVVLAALLLAGGVDRHQAAGLVTLLYASASIQLAMMTAARVFRYSGGLAAGAAAEQYEIAAREAVIAEVTAARQARYREARTLVAPILRGLADGTVDPADPAVQNRCAAAEAMLRRLLAEREDVPHPLLRALQPGIDEAVRRGAVVEVAPVGGIPVMPEEAGAALADVPLAVLAATRTRARVTVVSTGPGQVSVSVLAGGEAAATFAGRSGHDGVTVTADRDGDMLWVEARWTSP